MRYLKILSLMAIVSLSSCDEDPGIPFSKWDTKDDGLISREEFRDNWDDVDIYSSWDKDDDGTLEENEWQMSFDEYYYDWESDQLPVYVEWDLDDNAMVSEEEFQQGTFEFWDANNDGNLTYEEYEERAPYLIKD